MTAPLRNPDLVYKVVTQTAYREESRDGVFHGMPIDRADGFCHLSSGKQLGETLSLHFRGQRDLLILAVRSYDLGTLLRWEPSRGGQLFPHVYGTFPMSAVAYEATIAVDADGSCALPEWVR